LLLTLTLAAQSDNTTFTIIHSSNVVGANEANADGIGGTARAATIINQARADNPNLMVFDAGDRFLNPINFNLNAEIMNELGYNAMTLGNHEFNGGNVGLLNFLEAADFPFVAANIDFSASPLLADVISPYAVIDINGQSIGVIGLANEETPVLSSPGPDIVFLDDEALVTQQAVDELTAQGINIIVLLAHREANENAVLASTVSGVDVIVGGSDNVLMSNTDDNAAFPYPIETQSLSGEPVVIVQTPEDNLYLGQLTVTFSADGVLTDWSGDSILMDETIEADPEFDAFITELIEDQATDSIVIGESGVVLVGGDPCREEECTMGNLVTDIIREFSGADVAIYNSGGIRANIGEGDVSDTQLAQVFPFPNTVATLELRGSDLVAAIEHGVSLGGDSSVRGSGRFLQVSGMRYTWSPVRPVGNRVDSVEVLGADGAYRAIDENAIYSVVTNDFIRQGGDDFSVLDSNAIDPFDFGPVVRDIVTEYIGTNSPVMPEIEGRITRLDS